MHRETVPLTIRLPRRLYDWLVDGARSQRRSISGQAVYRLERAMVFEIKESANGADSERDPAGSQDPARLPE